MLNPFINLLGSVIHIYIMIVIVWVVLSILIQYDVVNRYNRLVSQIFVGLGQLVEPALEPIRKLLRKLLPKLSSIDLSPLVLILLLTFVKDAMYTWFYEV